MSEPTADDRARSALTEQFGRKEPRASKDTYTEQEWKDTFERPWIIPNKRYLADGGGDAYCRICVTDKKHGKMAAYRLHVAFEDDVMQVAKHGLIHVTCHNCGFDMLTPRKPRVRDAEFKSLDEYASFDPKRMQDLISLAQQQITAQQIQIRQEEALRKMAQMAPPQRQHLEELEKLRRHIEEQRRRVVELATTPPVIYGEKGDPDKWPGFP